jgi:hypothetical protein
MGFGLISRVTWQPERDLVQEVRLRSHGLVNSGKASELLADGKAVVDRKRKNIMLRKVG